MALSGGWTSYGPERDVPKNARMFVLTNEQLRFIASLVTTVNDVLSVQVPYPFYIDQEEEALIIHRMDFILRSRSAFSPTTGVASILQVDLQYADKEPAADWDGAGEDVEDENIQAMFDGPFWFGITGWTGVGDADATIPLMVPSISVWNVHYFPPDRNGLDAFFPVTIVFTNTSYDRDLVDQNADPATFSFFERVYVRVFFTTRKLTAQEQSMIRSEFYGLVPLS